MSEGTCLVVCLLLLAVGTQALPTRSQGLPAVGIDICGGSSYPAVVGAALIFQKLTQDHWL